MRLIAMLPYIINRMLVCISGSGPHAICVVNRALALFLIARTLQSGRIEETGAIEILYNYNNYYY